MPENPKFSSIKWVPTGQVFDVIATNADHATTADSATTANSATTATTAGAADKLSTKRNIDGIEFDGSANITHYATCTTAADVAEKVIDCQNFTLDVGSMILVKFNNGNTADISSVKLNVAGTGAKYLYYRGADLPSTFTINSNAVYLFVYHTPRWHLIGDIDTLHDFYASCSTSASTGTKEVTISNFKQQTGSMIVVRFSYTNTADPSSLYLKVNSETAKQIRYKNNVLKSAGFIEKDRLYLFTYDGYGWQIVGGFATRAEASSTNGNIVLDGTETTVYTHPTYTSYTGNPTENQTPGFGSTFTVSQVKTDSTGHVSNMTSRTITIPGTTFGGASSSSAGTIGLVPSPVASDRTKFLCGNGKWESLPSASTTASGIVQLSSAIDSNAGYYAATSSAVKQAYDLANAKSTVSFTRSLTSGTKIGSISINGTSTDIYCEKNTDTWTAMTGATSSANGTVGYVNATPPKDGYNTKYLRADGTWAVPPGVVDHSRRFSTSSNGQDNGWSTIVTADGIAKLQDSVSSLYVTRHTPVSGSTVYDPPEWYAARHSVGLMFANQNQVAIMSMASNNGAPLIKFGATGGGPNGTPVADGTGPTNPGNGVGWYFGLSGTTATTYNLDSFSTTDTKVTQTISTGNANYGILMSYTNSDSTATEGARKASGFYYNPSDGVMTVPTLKLTHTDTSQLLTSLNIRIKPSVIFDYDKLLEFSDYDNNTAAIHLVPSSDGKSSIGHDGIHWASSYINTMNGELNGSISSSTTATTQSDGDNSTKVATTAYVENSLPYYLVRTTENNTSANDWETVLGSSNFDKSRSNYLMLFRHGATSGTPQSWFAGQQCLGLFMRRTNMAAMISLNTNLAPTTLNYPRVTFATSKHASTSGDGPTATDGWYFSLKGKTASEYDLDDLSLTASSLNNSSNYDTYGLPLMSITPSTNDTAFKIKMSDGFRYSQTKGTTTVEGTAILVLGNNVAKNTAGNKTGGVCFYGSGTNFINLKAAEMAENNLTTWIPKVRIADSTLTATKVVYESTSGVTSGVTLNSGSNAISTSKPPTYFKVYMRKFRTTSGNSYTLAYYDSVDVPAVSNRATTFVLCDSYDVTSPAHATFTGYIKVTASSGYFKLDLYYSGKKYTLSGTSVTEANVLANEQAFGIYKIVAVYETHE